jgi:hypothetical protein
LLCWSFGNNQKSYIYWKDIEEWKYTLHKLHHKIWINNNDDLQNQLKKLTDTRVFFNKYKIVYKISYDQYINCKSFRYRFKKHIKEIIDLEWNIIQNLEILQKIENLQRLQSLQHLERLQSLQILDKHKITYSNLSRDEVELQDWDILYLDPPYEWTSWYNVWWIDYKALREFARKTKYPCYISSYKWPDDFVCYKTTYKSILDQKNRYNPNNIECLFWNWK